MKTKIIVLLTVLFSVVSLSAAKVSAAKVSSINQVNTNKSALVDGKLVQPIIKPTEFSITTYKLINHNRMVAKDVVILKHQPRINDKITINKIKYYKINVFGLNKWIKADSFNKFNLEK